MSRPSLIFTTIPNLGIYGLLGVFAVIISRFSQFDRARDYVLSAGGTNSEEYFDFIIGKEIYSKGRILFKCSIPNYAHLQSEQVLQGPS